jgi:preprotein translocase subunit SecF
VLGVFSLLGHFLGVEVDALFVTAILTVIGFSVHDTIVVFDRIRENLRRDKGSFETVVNNSILETIGRSINTSLTVLLTLLALFLFGGESIRLFVLALLIGIASGTYSSIFNASPLLVTWHNWRLKRLAKAKR